MKNTKRQTPKIVHVGTFNIVEITKYKHKNKGVWQGRQVHVKNQKNEMDLQCYRNSGKEHCGLGG